MNPKVELIKHKRDKIISLWDFILQPHNTKCKYCFIELKTWQIEKSLTEKNHHYANAGTHFHRPLLNV